VMPALIGATKIAHMIVRPSAEELLSEGTGKTHLSDELEQIGLHFFEIEIQDNSPLIGQTVADVEIGGGGFVVVAIKRADGTIVQNSNSELTLAQGDLFMIVGHKDALPQLNNRARSRAQTHYRGTKI
jgi:voltage-gated potassium channel